MDLKNVINNVANAYRQKIAGPPVRNLPTAPLAPVKRAVQNLFSKPKSFPRGVENNVFKITGNPYTGYIPTPNMSENWKPTAPQAAPAPTQVTTQVPAPSVNSRDWNSVVSYAANRARSLGIPPQVVVAQMANESARGASKLARTRNNFFGYNAVDSNPSASTYYPSAKESIEDYLSLLQKPKYSKAWSSRNNPKEMIIAINNAGYAGEPRTWRERYRKMTGKYPPFNSYADLIMNMKEWNSEY